MKNIRNIFIEIIRSHSSPGEVALGTSIGVFIGILPLYGFHVVIAITAAIIVPRANKLAVLLGTNISLPPAIPIISWTGYMIGKTVLGSGYPGLNRTSLAHLTGTELKDILAPLFLGSLILGVISSAAVYAVVFFIMKRIAGKK